jgi:serine/threonine protein phosphatase 1
MAHYISADIHGSFTLLWGRLKQLGFDPQADVLYSLGDLVNRGSESSRVAEWLHKPWFRPIRGNHESMVIQAWECPHDKQNNDLLKSVNGGWWFSLARAEQEAIANGLSTLPFFREINVAGQQIGLVHADIPEGLDWNCFKQRLQAADEASIEAALWSRGRWKEAIARQVPSDYLPDVEGVDWLFLGHSPVERPTKAGNVVFTDCGLWKGNSAGVFCLEDWLEQNA